jgi:hypothetical protein
LAGRRNGIPCRRGVALTSFEIVARLGIRKKEMGCLAEPAQSEVEGKTYA